MHLFVCLFCCYCCCYCWFLKLLHYFSEETFSFLGNPSKALDHIFNYYYFPALFVIPISDWSVQVLCSTSLTHHSSYGLCFTSDYFPFLLVLITLVLTQQNYLELGMPCLQADRALQPSQHYSRILSPINC